MIVYGDPQFKAGTRQLLHLLGEKVAVASPNDLDVLRALLIESGQFEQAVVDRLPITNDPLIIGVQTATNLAAAAFYAALVEYTPELPTPLLSVRAALELMSSELKRLRVLEDIQLTVKIPEGFEFYTLFPEQYCGSALQWLDKNHLGNRSRTALVVGIRSIGTSLSSLVATTVAAAGWQVRRITVRPTGHPFERQVELDVHDLGRLDRALVVDEGPGISGSSMAATAKALTASGFEPKQISFLPGHGGEPGSAASPETRAWWNSIARHVIPRENLRWNGFSLMESLAAKSNAICNPEVPLPQLEDLSAGRWRRKVYSNETDWPAVCTPFEKTKYLYTTRSGLAILWKFIGFGSMRNNLQSFREPAINGPFNWEKADPSTPLSYSHGFLALPWVSGTPLSRSDAYNPKVVSAIARRIIAAAGPPLSVVDHADSVSRLSEMLRLNIAEALGEIMTQRIQTAVKAAHNLPSGPSCGDGRLASHNWIQTTDGALFKTGSFGSRFDHTIVGRQPVIWDVAGAMVEWNLKAASVAPLLSAMNASGVAINPDALAFYCMAYAAFRMGQASFCANLCSDNLSEQVRLKSAAAFYREQLIAQLNASGSISTGFE
jgi:hypothetical protein